MKTRIISGIVMGIIVAAVLLLGFLINPIIITVAIALLAALAVYELLHNALKITDNLAVIGACIYSALFVFLSNPKYENLGFVPFGAFRPTYSSSLFVISVKNLVLLISVLYFIFAAFMILRNNKNFDIGKILALFGIPLPYAFAFSCLDSVINHPFGIYYLLLLLNFSSVCDMGAYFTGVTIGKHKLCPNLSPKKTVEGALGGIISSIVVTVILALCFSKPLLVSILLTIPFCILGMVGDLFASAIKRAVGIKDYGNLIPGHGGILDRLDSIIMIVPLLYICILLGVI